MGSEVQISEDYVIISGWRYRHWNRDVIVKEFDCGAERRPSVQGSQYQLRTVTAVRIQLSHVLKYLSISK